MRADQPENWSASPAKFIDSLLDSTVLHTPDSGWGSPSDYFTLVQHTKVSMKEDAVVVWRGRGKLAASSAGFANEAELYGLERYDAGLRAPGSFFWATPRLCPFCQTEMKADHIDDTQIEVIQTTIICPFCAYDHMLVNTLHFTARDMRRELGAGNIKDQFFHRPILKAFDLNDPKLAFAELGAWLSKYPKRLYDVEPRRFEELVEDVFKQLGYRTRLTQGSKDGGIDVYLLENDGRKAIVQVKRYAAHRKIGVDLINQVRGLKLQPIHKDVYKAFIVTSSSFTRGAIRLAGEAPEITTFEMELVDCEALLRELETYNVNLPSLPKHLKAKYQSK